jgi:hypothetical protein
MYQVDSVLPHHKELKKSFEARGTSSYHCIENVIFCIITTLWKIIRNVKGFILKMSGRSNSITVK